MAKAAANDRKEMARLEALAAAVYGNGGILPQLGVYRILPPVQRGVMQWARVADMSAAAIARKYLEALARLVDDVAASAEASHGSGNDEGEPS